MLKELDGPITFPSHAYHPVPKSLYVHDGPPAFSHREGAHASPRVLPRERQQRPIRRRIQRVHIAAPALQLHRFLALHGRLYAASCGGTTFPVAQVDI